MKTPVIIGGIAAIVALAVVAIAIAANGNGDDSPTDSGSNGGGAAGSCPAADVPGISQEERERCFGADSPGGGAPPVAETPSDGDTPVSDDETPAVSGPPATDTPSVPGAGAPPLASDRRAEAAPIDGLDVRIAESFPPQYFLHVQAGLPSGCAQQYTHGLERDGNLITVTVLNSMPADPDTICTLIYGTYELNIELGSDFEPGETYTVRVNDQETAFTAQ